MGILNIRPATRSNKIRVLLAFAGPSGSGKTLTALKVARGMVNNASEIGFLDTENGRGSLYYDKLDGKFQIADLYAPFSPSRYSDAIKEFQAEGVKVLVVDSISHEWEGEGGCDDIANAPLLLGKKMANWKGAKSEHKKLMQTLLYADMHIILCIRAREKTDFKNPTQPISLGIQPICEKNFMFEMTASIMMADEGKRQTAIKVPEFLKKAFGTGMDYIGEGFGKEVMKWINLGDEEHPELSKLKSAALMASEMGLSALEAYWKGLSIEMKNVLKPHMDVFKAAAIEVDKQAEDAKKELGESAATEAVSADVERIVAAIKQISTIQQLENSKSSFDLTDPNILFAYNDRVSQLTK